MKTSDNIFLVFIWAVATLFILIAIYPQDAQSYSIQANNIKPLSEDLKTHLKRNNRTYSVTIYADRLNHMLKQGYDDTKILDLLTIQNLECGKFSWECFNWNDVWPFQINKIHKEQYGESWKYYGAKDWGGLFKYQLSYANNLLNGYETKYCSDSIFKQIGKQYSNKARWECIGKSYNGHPIHKEAYIKLWWERREIIKTLLKLKK